MKKAGVVIVNWNTGSLLAKCLQSLQAASESPYWERIVVVDNASRDQSVEEAKTAVIGDERMMFIQLPENIGFVRANIEGIEALRANGVSSHILLLNPDTEVRPGALRGLLEALDRHRSAGVVGPRLLEPSGETQASVRSLPTLGVFVQLFLKWHQIMPTNKTWRNYLRIGFDYTQEQFVPQVMGAAFLIRDVVYERYQLDTQFSPYWFEEVDYCATVAEHGWRVLYTPQAEILHYGGVSFHQLVGWRKSWPWLLNSLRYAKKHLGWITTLFLGFLLPLALLLSFIAIPVQLYRRYSNKKRLV